MPKDYYKILGVSKTATHDEIKKAFHKKAHVLHPDKSGGDAEKFKEVNEAYQILGNSEKRGKYDKYGADSFQGQGFGGTGMGWEDFVRNARSGGGGGFGFSSGGVNFDLGDLGDMFGDMFGFGGGSSRSQRSRRGPKEGDSLEIELSIDFVEAIFGVENNIRLSRIVKCEHCSGNGAERGTKISKCQRCDGKGQIVSTRSTMFGTFQTSSICPECRGEGTRAEKPCKKCNGAGRIEKTEEVKIKIPAGIDNGQTVRMAGLGNAGELGGGAGDLYIHIRVKHHKKFTREGFNILSHEEISSVLATLGGTIEIQTVHGSVKLKIPQGTQPETKFKLAGKGVPKINSSTKGDHIVVVGIKIPQKLSRKERKLYEELSNEKSASWF